MDLAFLLLYLEQDNWFIAAAADPNKRPFSGPPNNFVKYHAGYLMNAHFTAT
jgi:hypothetical protein